ncbi:MAG: permease prefix domain 1-containing protein [Phycisphaerales bacterium]
MLDSIRAYLSRVDERPVEQIDRDIDDELNAHIAELESELVQSGLDPAAAQKQAISRFGNPQTHKRRCRDVALMERRMKTYAQMIVTVVCGLLIGAVTTMVWMNQQTANAALATMNDRVEKIARSLDQRTLDPRTTATAPVQSSDWGVVYIKGTPVDRPGVYNLPAGGATLRRILAAAGVNDKFVARIEVRSNRPDSDTGRWTMSGDDLRDPGGKDVSVSDKDLITVVEASH